MPRDQKSYLPLLNSRQDYFDFLNGYAVERLDELRHVRTKKALVKSFLLETVRDGRQSRPVEMLLQEAGLHLDRVDDTLFRVKPVGEDLTWGLLELLERRHPVVYTMLDSNDAQRWMRTVIDASPWLDRVWLSAPIF